MPASFADAPLAALLGWALFVPALLLAPRRIERPFLPTPGHQHAWLAAAALPMLALLALRTALAAPGPAAADMIGYTLLMAWSEALLSGMFLSALVIYRPHLVMTYRQDLYLPPDRVRR